MMLADKLPSPATGTSQPAACLLWNDHFSIEPTEVNFGRVVSDRRFRGRFDKEQDRSAIRIAGIRAVAMREPACGEHVIAPIQPSR
jgi:hypothetical protein